MSPDGRSVYLTTRGRHGEAVLDYERNPDSGGLRFSSCAGAASVFGLPCSAAPNFDGSGVVSVSPDGRSVYVGGVQEATVFQRDVTNGHLAFQGCLTNDGQYGDIPTPGCEQVPDVPREIVVAPDGRFAYGVGRAVSEFQRLADPVG